MAAKTGPLGIRYSPWSIIFTVIVIGVAYELTAPAAWQLVGALPKGFVIAVLIVGATTILTAFITDNVNRFQSGLKLISGVLLLFLLLLFGYAVYFYYPVTPAAMPPAPSVATLHILTDEQAAQIARAFGDLAQAIRVERKRIPTMWPWGIGGCRAVVSANPGNEKFRDEIISIANRNSCHASVGVASTVAPYIVISSKGSNFDSALQAMDVETEQFIAALRSPPLSLDVQRGPAKPQDGALHIELGNNSPRLSR